MQGREAASLSALDAANAARSRTALRLAGARDRVMRKSVSVAFALPAARGTAAVVGGIIGGMPRHNPASRARLSREEEAKLASDLENEVEKVLAIMAVLISEAESDIAAMNELIELIASLDDVFFDFAGQDVETLQKRLPRETAEKLAKFIFWYRRKLV